MLCVLSYLDQSETLPLLLVGSTPFKFIPLLDASVPPYRTDVDHPVPELDKSATLLGQLKFCNVLEAEVHQILILLFSEPVDEAVTRERLSETVGDQSVLGKGEVEEGGDGG